MLARGFVESAPRAFELALHFVSALRQRGFGLVLAHDWAAGHRVVDVDGRRLVATAGAPLGDLNQGEFSVLAARAWMGSFDGRATGHDDHEGGDAPDAGDGERACITPLAVIDTALAGHGWFAAGRSVWAVPDFAESDAARRHERLILAVDDSRSETVGVHRVKGADTTAAAVTDMFRRVVLRELVLRPVFGDGVGAAEMEWVTS